MEHLRHLEAAPSVQMHQVPASFFIEDIEAHFRKERAMERGEVPFFLHPKGSLSYGRTRSLKTTVTALQCTVESSMRMIVTKIRWTLTRVTSLDQKVKGRLSHAGRR